MVSFDLDLVQYLQRLLGGNARFLCAPLCMMIACSSGDLNEAAAKGKKNKEERLPPAIEMTATISIDAAKNIKQIPRGLYGTHAAWVWDSEGLWDGDKNQFQPKPLQAAENLRPGPVRFPGGIGADFYHWRDGIGPEKDRPIRPHGSDKEKSHNGFGTHELMDFCRRIGTEPILMPNILGGTPEEAAAWVDYCNRPNNPERARNGSPEPFHVRLWEIGNEPYVKAWSPAQKQGQMTASAYADKFLAYAAAMKKVDPSIQLLAVGGANFGTYAFLENNNWDETLLKKAGPAMDYLAVHNAYTPVLIRKAGFYDVYRAMVTFPEHIKENFNTLNQQIDTYAPESANHIKLAVTEWGPFFAPRTEEVYLDHSKTLGAAISVAATMQVFLGARRLELANFFKFIDLAFQGCLSHDGVPKPSYFALEMFSRHFGEELVASSTESPTYNFPKAVGAVDPISNVPFLTTVASTSADRRKLFVLAVNRNFANPMRTKINLKGFHPAATAIVWTLTAPSLDANNGIDLPNVRGITWPKPAKAPENSMFDQGHPGAVTTQRSEVNGVSESWEVVIPPRAVVSFELSRADSAERSTPERSGAYRRRS
jgi:alpha-N-arabinofuranosidase